MGTQVGAYCPCGYRDSFACGGGMGDFRERCGFPFRCHACGELYEGNLLVEVSPCPACGGTGAPLRRPVVSKSRPHPGLGYVSVFEWNMGGGRWAVIDTRPHQCPRCNQDTMRFMPQALYD